jgi:hypothetical protein
MRLSHVPAFHFTSGIQHYPHLLFCLDDTVKPRFNVPAFSEILDLVMIFFMSRQ